MNFLSTIRKSVVNRVSQQLYLELVKSPEILALKDQIRANLLADLTDEVTTSIESQLSDKLHRDLNINDMASEIIEDELDDNDIKINVEDRVRDLINVDQAVGEVVEEDDITSAVEERVRDVVSLEDIVGDAITEQRVREMFEENPDLKKKLEGALAPVIQDFIKTALVVA